MSELRFIVTDKAHAYKGTIVARKSTVTLLGNKPSRAEFTIDDDHRMLSVLAEDGARVRVLLDGEQELAGVVEEMKGTFPTGDVKVTVLDDFLDLSYILGWPKPAAAISAQTDEYRRYSGPSETVAKLAIAEASTRLGLGWTVVPTTGKGSDIRVDSRFHPLADKIIDGLTADKLQLTVIRSEAGVVTVDVRQGTVVPRTLTLESGLIDSGTWSLAAPTATRVIVGGAGEGVERQLELFADAALESAWGMKREIFRDARMSGDDADLSDDATQSLAEGQAKASIQTKLNESAWFRYRHGYVLGDVVTVQVGPVTVSDVISQIDITDAPGSGITIQPSIGEVKDTNDKKIVAALGQLARGVRDQGRR